MRRGLRILLASLGAFALALTGMASGATPVSQSFTTAGEPPAVELRNRSPRGCWSPGVAAGAADTANLRPRRQGATAARRINPEGILDGTHPLPPGSYQLTLSASDAAGRTTATQQPTFTLLP